MTYEQQTEARNLFFQTDLSKTEIAGQTKVPRQLIHSWIREHNWDRQKKSAAIMPSLLAENCYHLIANFQRQLLTEDRIMRPITRAEADTLHKLTLTVKALKKGSTVNESMELFGLFMDRVNERSPEMAQAMVPFVEDFISAQSATSLYQFRPDGANSMGFLPKKEVDVKEEQLDLEDIVEWTQNGFPSVDINDFRDTEQPGREQATGAPVSTQEPTAAPLREQIHQAQAEEKGWTKKPRIFTDARKHNTQ